MSSTDQNMISNLQTLSFENARRFAKVALVSHNIVGTLLKPFLQEEKLTFQFCYNGSVNLSLGNREISIRLPFYMDLNIFQIKLNRFVE